MKQLPLSRRILKAVDKENTELKRESKVNNDIFVQNMTIASDRISELENVIRELRGVLLDKSAKQVFKEDSATIMKIDDVLGDSEN